SRILIIGDLSTSSGGKTIMRDVGQSMPVSIAVRVPSQIGSVESDWERNSWDYGQQGVRTYRGATDGVANDHGIIAGLGKRDIGQDQGTIGGAGQKIAA